MSDTEPKKRARPMKFVSVQGLQQRIDEYFGECDPHRSTRSVWVQGVNGTKGYWAEENCITDQKPYTITGLALALDTNRQTLLNYQNPEHYPSDLDDEIVNDLIDTVSRAKLKCEQFAEQHLYTGKSPAGAMFNLKNNHAWVDKSEVEHSGTVADDLSDLENDEGNKEVAAAAAKALEEQQNGDNKQGPEAEKQVVAADAPVQNQE
jgi:hypothetical protein